MQEYTGFARVYDMFMDNVPYDEWADYLDGLIRENLGDVSESMTGDKPIVAELGCGTGKITRRLYDRGYDMIGLDISPEMLQIAREKEAEAGRADSDDGILYLLQDMREMELYGTVAAFVSICDSMNYILEEEDMEEVFRLVANYMDPNGAFIFDLNTEYYYSEELGERTICENRDEGSFIWENYYDVEERINEFDMTIYYKCSIKDTDADAEDSETGDAEADSDGSEELYTRCEETHYQRAWRICEIKSMLEAAGLEMTHLYEVGTHDAPADTTQRVYVVARKCRQN